MKQQLENLRTTQLAVVAVLALCFSFGMAQETNEGDLPSVKEMTIEVVKLKYVDEGQGEPVVFVHGNIQDHRVWEEQREEIVAQGYRFIAPDLRYHGDTPWTDDGEKYSMATHVSDLAAFIEQLDVGPVHVVGWSDGSSYALGLGVLHSELVRSLFIYEPALGSMITDQKDLEALGKEFESFGPTFAAVQEGNMQRAARLLINWVNDQPGTFAALPEWRRNVILDNSQVMGPALAGPEHTLTCDQLEQIDMPVTVARGELTRPFWVISTDTAHSCIPGSQLVTIPGTRHLAPGENPSAFNEAVLSHLTGN